MPSSSINTPKPTGPKMMGETAADRQVIAVTGKDALTFLQGIVSNDVLALAKDQGIRWAALLTPQGKYLADFFVVKTPDALLIDVKSSIADSTRQRLMMYRLRADVQLTQTDMAVTRGLGAPPAAAFADPRHPALGWRAYGPTGLSASIDWNAIRVDHCIPETGVELIADESYLLETGFERLHGVDFRKGCYVGQEVTARMKHKTDLRKGLVRVRISGSAPVGTPILAGGKASGMLFTQSGDHAIAYLRLDRLEGPLVAGTAQITVE